MSNLITYLQTQQRTFSEAPFNDVDSLILSTISYFDFETIDFADCTTAGKVRLHDILALGDRDNLMVGNWLQDTQESADFWIALMASRRYRDAEVGFYTYEFSDVVEKQFAAISVFLPNQAVYLSFRGTDGRFAGWKEDFNMCFKKTIPSQVSALRYLSGVASATKGQLILGGHSKGGNLAEYAALTAQDQVYDRITAVYNHDGPSFLDDPSPRIADEAYREKLHKTVPESSAFGMIMEKRNDYKVVKSSASLVFQHQPFSWIVEEDDFCYQENLNKNAAVFGSAINEWLESYTPEERGQVIDAVYDLFYSLNVNSWSEFAKEIGSNTGKILIESTKLDPETKKLVFKVIASLVGIFKDKTVEEYLPDPINFKLAQKGTHKEADE